MSSYFGYLGGGHGLLVGIAGGCDRRGFVDGGADAEISSAAAEVAVHGAVDVGVGGFRVDGQER